MLTHRRRIPSRSPFPRAPPCGRALQTRYEIDGSRLIQHVDTTDAQYPVVADPDVVVFCGGVTCSFYFKRAATKAMQGTIGSGGTGASILAGSLGCQKIPHAIGAGACAAAIVVYGVRAAYSINKAANRNGCFVVRVNLLLAPTALAVGAVTFDDVPASNKHCKA